MSSMCSDLKVQPFHDSHYTLLFGWHYFFYTEEQNTKTVTLNRRSFWGGGWRGGE